MTNSNVEEILLNDNNEVCGVKLNGDIEIKCKNVISTLGYKLTGGIVPK